MNRRLKMTEQQELFYIQKGIAESTQKALESIKRPGETFIQCLDKETFNGVFYAPSVLISNQARIYDLSVDNLLDIKLYPGDTRHKFLNKYTNKKVYVHRFVANYFCNKAIIKAYGNDINLYEVNHKHRFDETKSNEENNNASNLEWQYKPIHDEITNIQLGHERKNQDIFQEQEQQLLINSAPFHENSVSREVTSVEFDEQGNKIIHSKENISITFNSPKVNDIGYYLQNGATEPKECRLLEIKYYNENMWKEVDSYIHYIVELLQDKSIIEIGYSEYRDKQFYDKLNKIYKKK